MTAVLAPITVSGEPLAERYDTVLAHEHLRIDIRCWFDAGSPLAAELRDLQVTDRTASKVQEHPFACLDNLVLDDLDLLARELSALQDLGRTLIVDVTPENVGRDAAYLEELSARTGIEIVYGCGLYIDESRPDGEPCEPESYRDAICAQFDASPRPSVIGEIGTGSPIKPSEEASLIGAAMAQAELGVPLYVHLDPWARLGAEVLDIVEANGADLTRTVLCHLDVQIPGGLDYHRSLLARGCTIAFDIWGDEFPYGGKGMPSDRQRLEATIRLIEDGYCTQLVHSQDVCTKTQLKQFGGAGFAHLPKNVRTMMEQEHIEARAIARQLADNALDLLGARRAEG